MKTFNTEVDSLKQILDNLRSPERLDAHPWAKSLTVREAAEKNPALKVKSAEEQLVLTVGELFRQLMPASPPQDGKRLDTRWGRFGLLAANYFAPLLYGRIYPHSLREAWRRIDQAVLLFVYGTTADQLKPEQIEPYRFVGGELDFPANSTISDWHRNGVQDLADLFINHERHLSVSTGEPSNLFNENHRKVEPEATGKRNIKGRRTLWRWVGGAILILLLAGIVIIGVKGWQVYGLFKVTKEDISELQGLNLTSFDPDKLERAGALLEKSNKDATALRAEAAPWLWVSDGMGWVPKYGGDLKNAGDLLEMASDLTQAGSLTYKTAYPIWQALHQNEGELRGTELAKLLLNTQPRFSQAQATLQEAIQARKRIKIEDLSPTTQAWLGRVDPYLSTFDNGLSLALSLPGVMGAGKDGPKTYLILVQNEDELRPTGGFITAVGKLVVWNGELISWNVADSYSVDDIDKAYPSAPWQLQSFMNLPILTFRDSNWSPDYPTTVEAAEYLYAYTNSFSVNGVIAIDQHVLKSLLGVTGPIYVSEIDTTVSSDNVEETMRTQKVPPTAELNDPNWYRKHFLNPIAGAILNKVLSGKGFAWEQLLKTTAGELDERHIQVELDNPVMSKMITGRGWDGAVARSEGDFLMLVDTNVGYNKTNAVVSENAVYDIDLSNTSAPTSNLAVFHHNAAKGAAGICDQQPAVVDPSMLEFWYAIDRCYYNYLRVYVPSGAGLKAATPHAVSLDEMVMLDQDVPARVDTLDEELTGLEGFGTLLVVPIGESLETDFQFNLPADVIKTDPSSHDLIYQVKVQKQAGTDGMPVTVRVHLPPGAQIKSVSPEGSTLEGNNLLFNLKLTTDITIRIEFKP